MGYVSHHFRQLMYRLAGGCLACALFLIVAVGSGVGSAAACSCGGESVQWLIENTDGGFIGVPETTEAGYRFAVSEWLSPNDDDDVVTLPGGRHGCGLWAQPGSEVAVFFNRGENGERYSNLCWTFSPLEVRVVLDPPVADPHAGLPSLLVATGSHDRHLWVLDDQERLVASASLPPGPTGYLNEVEICPGDRRMVEVWSGFVDSLVVVRELDTLEIVRSDIVGNDILQDGSINLLVCRDVDASDVHVGIASRDATWFLHQVGGERSSPIVALGPDRLYSAHFSEMLNQVVLVTSRDLRFVGVGTGRVRFTAGVYLNHPSGYVTTSLSPDGTTLAIAVQGVHDGTDNPAGHLTVVDLVSGQTDGALIPLIEFPQHIWIEESAVVMRDRRTQAGVVVDTTTLRVGPEPDVFAKNKSWTFPSQVSGAEVRALGPQGSIRRLELDAPGSTSIAEDTPLIPTSWGPRVIPLGPRPTTPADARSGPR